MVKIAIISDIHGNKEALRAVLRDAEARGAERVWCLGDIVGYGPEPSEVIEELRRRGAVLIAGNHDLAVAGKMGLEEFNPVAARAAEWTRERLTRFERDFLAELPLVRIEGAFTLVHGSLRSPEWEYLLTAAQAAAHFALQTTPYSAVGHSHLPFTAAEADGLPVMRRLEDGEAIPLGGGRLIINPGGAGQPRDGDRRAPYMLYDEDSAAVAFHRVPYDFEATQRKIRDAGLPEFLAARLAEGR